jgi:membrane protein YdbS with pleckstrin-like domain
MPRPPPSQQADAPPLSAEQNWHPISSRYVTELRIHLGLTAIFLVLLAGMGRFWGLGAEAYWVAAGLAVAFILLGFVWAPRRFRYTRYLRRELDMNMQSGYWWHKTISVPINRMQHLEISQGPIQRLLKLNTLVIYTAGGGQSDLKLPGLTDEMAHQLKASLLKQIVDEDSAAEENVNGPS